MSISLKVVSLISSKSTDQKSDILNDNTYKVYKKRIYFAWPWYGFNQFH